MTTKSYTAIVEREGSGYVALCPELDVASQGETVESATANIKEAVDLFLECAYPAEVERRLHTEVFVPKSRRAPVVACTELRVIERLLNPIEFSIIAVSMQNAGEFYDLGLFIDRVDNSIFSLRNPEAGESTIEMRELFRIGWTGRAAKAQNLKEHLAETFGITMA
jgi:predicted RNase H-like HicB family nuclease